MLPRRFFVCYQFHWMEASKKAISIGFISTTGFIVE